MPCKRMKSNSKQTHSSKQSYMILCYSNECEKYFKQNTLQVHKKHCLFLLTVLEIISNAFSQTFNTTVWVSVLFKTKTKCWF